MSSDSTVEVDASPIKEFFISIITRDITILETIPEFIDNSIDGATRHSEEDQFDGYYVEVELSGERVIIKDNCGGIEKQLAEDYAFRFGRHEDIKGELDSKIGKFGVGMKRALFKLGNHFIVESKTDQNHFIIEVDVEEWLGNPHEWNFDMEMVSDITDDSRCNLTETGTYITISELHPEVSKKFDKELFHTRLKKEIGSKNRTSIKNGMDITVNQDAAFYAAIELFESDDLTPAYKEYNFDQGVDDVQVEIQCGLGERSPENAGWYIFCNGRLVLESDTSEVTGWGTETTPKYHNDFSRFRGIVNFKSSDPGALPWNTTKTDINPDKPVYRNARMKMKEIMGQVLDTLRDIANEKSESGESLVEQKIENGESVEAIEITPDENQDFTAPDSEETDITKQAHITYKREKDRVEAVKQELDVSSNSAAGRETFEYFYDYEVEK